jgi:hypothetical protein
MASRVPLRTVSGGNAEAAMENLMNLAGMASAVAGSFAVSLLLAWLSLRGILLLMPVRTAGKVQAPGTDSVSAGWVPAVRPGMDRQRAA